jgi:flagellar assembly protein FliH
VAATQAMRTEMKEADSPGLPVLERLQYRAAQSVRGQDEVSPRDPHNGSASAPRWEVLFPSQGGGFAGVESPQGTDHRSDSGTDGVQQLAEFEKRLEEERAASTQAIAMAREQGRREGRQAIEQQLSSEQQRLQAQILQTLEQFRLERLNYFHGVEGEVVRLALAIAARILHREAHLDPLLLTGAVRVALEKLGDSSQVVMRVPPREIGQWKEFFRGASNSRIQPGVLEDPSLSPGECVLVTELGTIELGVRAQLQEIEKGFFDLLDRRPAESVANATSAGRGAV